MALRMPKIIMMTLALAAFLVTLWTGDAMARDRRLSNWMTIEQIRDKINQDLHPGMSLSQVNEYFTKNNTEYGYYKDANQVLAMVKISGEAKYLLAKTHK